MNDFDFESIPLAPKIIGLPIIIPAPDAINMTAKDFDVDVEGGSIIVFSCRDQFQWTL